MSKPSWIGATLKGRYHIEELLGQGGMSAVYKASDPNLKRVVAVKLIHAHLAGNPQFVSRFEEEAAAVAKLRHPNIVQVYDFDHDDDTYYMILEFVPGETLNDRLKRLNQARRQLSLGEALQVLSQVCDAVDYAHKRGLVHRDIKPANIMLDVQGHAILMDFGIVKIVGGEKHTSTGAVLGTALYMSPEQIKGEAAEARSDIYSLGVTLFEMLSGKPPFQADSVMTIMMMHLTDPVPDINDLRPGVPAEVMAIIQKAMAKQPQDRFQSAGEMAQALRDALGRIKTDQVAAIHPDDKATFVEDNSTLLDVAAPLPPRPAVVLPKAQPKPAQQPVDAGQTVHDTGPMPAIPRAAQSSPQKMVSSPRPAASQSASHPVAYPSSTVAGISSTGAQSASHRTMQPAPASKALPWLLILGGGVGVFAILAVILLVVLINTNRGNGGAASQAALSARASQTASALAAAQIETVVPSATATQAPTSAASATPVPTATATTVLTPTDTPLPSETPTETVPPGILYVRINRITINAQNQYVVEYETFEYTEKLPGTHVHFFFNTVPPEQAGMPGNGPWILYGGPRPFTEYSVSDKPAAATKMCALVANPNHSVQPNSGNCVDLP